VKVLSLNVKRVGTTGWPFLVMPLWWVKGWLLLFIVVVLLFVRVRVHVGRLWEKIQPVLWVVFVFLVPGNLDMKWRVSGGEGGGVGDCGRKYQPV